MKKKLLLAACNCLTILAIFTAIAAMVTVATTEPGRAPSLMGVSLLRVVSGSMEPAIAEGSLSVVRAVEPEDIAVGDIISFYSRDSQIYGKINTHRVTEITEKDGNIAFATKGDASLQDDKNVTVPADLVGKVVYSSHFWGRLIGITQNKYVFFAIILTPLVVIFILSVRKVIRIARDEIKLAEREAMQETASKRIETGSGDDEQNPDN